MIEESSAAIRHAEFRFRRQICSGAIDVTVRLAARPSAEFAVIVDPKIPKTLNVDAVIAGIRAARDAAPPDAILTVIITSVEDHIGETSELGHKICGEAAAYHLFGQPDRAPYFTLV